MKPTQDKNHTACRKKTRADGTPCSIAIPAPLQEAIIRRARAEDRSFSAVVRRAVAQYVGEPAA